jgi:small conductance mechanosensitive channel
VRVAGLLAVVLLGWAFARSVGRALGPVLFRRFSPPTAGTLGFFIRLATLAAVVIVALYVAGFSAQELVLGGAFAAAILGLAGQQTLGNLIAGIVLLSARPFRLGDRVRLEGGMLGGNHQVEGIVSSLGLLYTTLAPDEESITVPNTALAEAEGNIIVPNNLVLASTIVPLGELAAVDLHVRLPRGVRPSELQDRVVEGVSVTLRSPPEVDIEQMDAQGVVVRIAARPEAKTDGPRLADELVSAIEDLLDHESGSDGRLDGDRQRQGQPVA